MNKYEAIITKIRDWAERENAIRAAIIIGSQARSDEPADEWSDLDVILIARDPPEYIQSTAWIAEFGTPLVTFTEGTFDGSSERRVLYEGFLDVDFAIDDPDRISTSLQSHDVRAIFQRGYRVLADKDHWAASLSEACSAPAAPASKSSLADEVKNEIHDYWYHCVWTVKKLRRGELWMAMSCLNCYLRARLLRMIERLAVLSGGEAVDTWHNGRFLERWADRSVVERLQGSFTDYDRAALTAALHHQMELYHDVASQVAARHGLSYPAEEVQAIRDWVQATDGGGTQ
jgi:aminoglycoside 6-adenylyltransferase